jgi:hypothetical protein
MAMVGASMNGSAGAGIASPNDPTVGNDVPDTSQGFVTQPNEHDDVNAERDREREDRDIIAEAHDRFVRCQGWYAVARQRWLEDLKFAEGDSDNQYQWPNAIRRERDIDERPCLTINKTRQHNLHIINDAKQNKPAIKVRATGNGATAESAKVLNAIMRHIEYTSNAQVAYDTATGFQVRAGLGYLQIVTDWEDPESFEQAPYIRRVTDPLSVYLDPEAKEADKSDGRFAFKFEDIARDEFDKLYPEYKSFATATSIDDSTGWLMADSVRLAEYFRKVEHEDTLYQVQGQQGSNVVFRKSDLERDPALLAKIASDPKTRSRPSTREVIEWYLVIGNKITERNIWPGKCIPLIPVIGEETVIQGEYDCKGHTRALRDPQRMYNYMSSVAVEYSAVQTKAPWIAPAEAIEGYEVDWANANRINKSLLAYNALRDDGSEIPPPQRVSPPVSMPAAIEGMQTAMNEMMFASGQYQAEMGQQGNERSAKAINERQRQAETSTYHFVDNLAVAIRAVAKQLLDLIPKLYSTKRIMNILAEDGTSIEVQVDPSLQKAMQIQQLGDAQAIKSVLFNPSVGKYDVWADVGPDWGTKRQETADALTLLMTQAPQIAPIVADLLMSNYDFDGAQEAAARLRRMVPTQALGTGPTVQEQQLTQQVQQLTALLQKSMEELSKEKLKLLGKAGMRDIDAYKAFTDRLKVLTDAAAKEGTPVDPGEINELIESVTQGAMANTLEQVQAADEPQLSAGAMGGQAALPLPVANAPPVPGAKRGPDGHWYVRNYARSGQYALVQ